MPKLHKTALQKYQFQTNIDVVKDKYKNLDVGN